jgi:hypothetical protein
MNSSPYPNTLLTALFLLLTPGSPADKGVTGSSSDPKASPAGSPPSPDATKPDAKPDAKADAKPDGKTDDKVWTQRT